jgi:translation initiation factor IF-2
LPNSPAGLPPSESYIQIKRDDHVIFDKLRIKSMRHVKKDIASAGKGMECGILLVEDIDLDELTSGDILFQIERTPSYDTIS